MRRVRGGGGCHGTQGCTASLWLPPDACLYRLSPCARRCSWAPECTPKTHIDQSGQASCTASLGLDALSPLDCLKLLSCLILQANVESRLSSPTCLRCTASCGRLALPRRLGPLCAIRSTLSLHRQRHALALLSDVPRSSLPLLPMDASSCDTMEGCVIAVTLLDRLQ